MSNDRTLRDAAEAGRAWAQAYRAEVDRRALRDAAIRSAALAGATHAAIAEAVGIERSLVTRILSGSRGAQAERRAAQAIRPNR